MILKIHFDPPSRKYGTGNFIYNLTENYIKANYRVKNICCNKYESEDLDKSDFIILGKRYKKRYPLITFLYEFLILEFYSLFFFLKNKNKIDIIFTYGDTGLLVSLVNKIYKKKLINYFFVLYKDLCFLRDKEKKKHNFFVKFTIKNFTINILSYIEDKIKIFVEKIIIANGRNFLTASKLTKKRLKKKNNFVYNLYYFHNVNKITKSIKNLDKKINLLLIGNDIYLKGLVRFLNIIEKDKKFYLDHTNINIVGVSNLDLFKKVLTQKKLENIINVSGHTNNINRYYENCDIFVNLSKIEGWNISLLEAYLDCKIIFTTKVGCVSELLLDNKNVILCSKYNDFLASKKMKDLIYNSRDFTIDDNYLKIKKKLDNKELRDKYCQIVKNL